MRMGLVFLCVGLAACSITEHDNREPLRSWEEILTKKYIDDAAYRIDVLQENYYKKETDDEKRQLRDQVISELIIVAKAYHELKDDALNRDNVEANLLFDVGQLVASAWSTIATPNSTKTLLSGIATGLKGVQESVNHRVFYNQSVAALLATMHKDRLDKEAVLRAGMKSTPADWPLGTALDDWVTYFLAGGLTDAIRTLAANAKQEEQQSEAMLEDVRAATDGSEAWRKITEFRRTRGIPPR